MAINGLSLLVLRAKDPARLASFYEKLGLSFVEERHGKGPSHHSCQTGGSVFEIYPLEGDALSTRDTRLGFRVDSVSETIAACDATLLMQPRRSKWGTRAVIQDPEGHKVELLEASEG